MYFTVLNVQKLHIIQDLYHSTKQYGKQWLQCLADTSTGDTVMPKQPFVSRNEVYKLQRLLMWCVSGCSEGMRSQPLNISDTGLSSGNDLET